MQYGIKVNGKGKKSHGIKLEKNLYGTKHADKVWHDHLTNKLKSIDVIPSKCDTCLYYRANVIFFFYVDDGIFISKNPLDAEAAIADLRNTGLVCIVYQNLLLYREHYFIATTDILVLVSP